MRRLDVVGIDFEFRAGIGGRRAIEQHGADRLFGIGAVGPALHRDAAEVGADRMARQRRAHDLAGGGVQPGVGDFGDDFQRLAAGGELRRAQREVRAFGQPHIHCNTPVDRPRRKHAKIELRALAQRDHE
ncbi:hypothetical protein COLO4_01707, partial [Corchorus olitorius]